MESVDARSNCINFFEEQAGESTVTLPRRIPNILKNNVKMHKTVKEPLDKVVNMKENIQEPYSSVIALDSSFSEKSYVETDNKCRKSTRRRKQEHNFTDLYKKSPTWNIHTLVNENKEIKRRRTNASTRKNKSRNKLSVLKTKKQNENSLPSTSHNISTEFMTEFHSASYSREIKPIELQDSIDFSSNEIFSNYDFTEYATDFKESFNSSSTIYDSEICETECDINGNELDMDEIQCSNLLECLSENNNESGYFSNSGCDYCHKDCATHWIANSGKNKMLSVEDRVLSDNVIIDNNEFNCQLKIDCSGIPVAKADINSTDEYFNEKYNENYSCLSIPAIPNSCTFDEKCDENSFYLLNEEHNESNSDMDISNIPEIVSQYTLENAVLSPMESTISCIEDIEERNLNELPEIENAECNAYNNIYDNFLHKLDLSIALLEADEIDTLQTQVYTEEDADGNVFQCSLCSLMFCSARTLAMHQAAAHGGMYIILCESCGRLFNRKYHFNRHFIHCVRFKEPYKCDMCTKHYRHKSSLIHHLKSVHGVQYANNRSNKYTCVVCNKIYRKFGAFHNHMRKHKNDC